MARKGNKLLVLVGTSLGLIVAGLPLMSRRVWDREQMVHQMRDESYDAKDAARNARMRVKREPS
jgi:hypothetical protein